MKNKLWPIFFAIMIAIIGYIMVSTAASHTAKDNAAMGQWLMDTAIRRSN